jgi:hypothetical protein
MLCQTTRIRGLTAVPLQSILMSGSGGNLLNPDENPVVIGPLYIGTM